MQVPSSSPMQWETQHQSALEVLIDHITSPPLLAYPDYNAPFIVHTDASQDGLSAGLYQEQNGSTRVIAYASRTLTPSECNYHMHSGKLEFLALKWAVTEQFRDHLYYAPEFFVYTDNNPLTYVLTSAKLNASGLRWVGELADFNFEIRYPPGMSNTDADSLSRIPADFKNCMGSCTERVVPESLQSSICGIQTLSSGDSIWLMALTDDNGEPHQMDIPSPIGCHQVKVVDIVRAQQEDPHIGRILQVVKTSHKPAVGQKQKEPLSASNAKIAKKWLVKLGRDEKFLPNRAQIFVCSEHFTEDCFEVDYRHNLLGGATHKRKKKFNAVPTIFKKTYSVPQVRRIASERRHKNKESREVSPFVYMYLNYFI